MRDSPAAPADFTVMTVISGQTRITFRVAHRNKSEKVLIGDHKIILNKFILAVVFI